MLTYTLREAADLCDTTVKALRNRADRGSLQTVLRDGERRVPHVELERAGLLPDAELKNLRRRVELLTDELTTYRQLVVSTEREAKAERKAREQLEVALFERQAAATQAEAAAAEAGTAAAQAEQKAAKAVATSDELQALEADLRAAGPIRAWKLARTRRKAADAA
jgi:hypothetical protein